MKPTNIALSQRHDTKPWPRKPQRQSPSHQPGIAQPKIPIASHMKKQPVAPPAYRPQPAPKAMQTKMAGGLQRQPLASPAVNHPQPVLQAKSASGRQPLAVNPSARPMPAPSRTAEPAVVQPKSGARSSTVIQCKNCVSCLHKAHEKDCTVQVAAADGSTKACGCKSHSIKFDKSQKFNPGGGKRERMLANKIK
jgi:hypothetical protein